MTLRLVVAVVLAVGALALLGLTVRQYRAGRATGNALALSVGGGAVTLVMAGAVALGGS